MVKIATLTFHRTTNYGAVLQAFALQKELEKLNVETEIIDYHCESIEKREGIIPPRFTGSLRRFISDWRDYYAKRTKLKVLNKFIEKNIIFSAQAYTQDNINSVNEQYDAVIVGSDMVWELGITGEDYTYFLSFLEPTKRFSYAASIGHDCFTDKTITRTRDELKQFEKISVRESSAKEIVEKATGKNVVVSVDPTLLFDESFWIKYEEEISCLSGRRYIFLYFLDSNSVMVNAAKKLSAETGAEVVILSDSNVQFKGCKTIKDISIGAFLYCIHNAELVITGSYHGMVFSINYNKPFMYFNRANSTRMESIASILGCSNRRLTEDSIPSLRMEYNSINQHMCAFRNESTEYILSVIKSVEGRLR